MRKNLQTQFSTRQYMVSRDFEIYYYNEHYTSKVESHTHDYYEFYFFLEGDVSMEIENELYRLRCRDMVLIPPHRKHHAVIGNHALPYRRFVFWISRDYCNRLIERSASFGYLMQRVELSGDYIFHNDVITFNAIQFKIFQLIEEMQMERFGREARVPLLAEELLLHLNRVVYDVQNPASAKDEGLYQNLIYYIDEHLDEDLSLEKLAGAFFVSRYYIAHVFKEQAGLPVHQYILKKRMQASKEAILGGESISQIYSRFGFKDYSSFYRAFKREYGVSPKEYREENLR